MSSNKIAPLWHACLTSLGACAEGVQIYCPCCTFPAILYCTMVPIFRALWIVTFLVVHMGRSEKVRNRWKRVVILGLNFANSISPFFRSPIIIPIQWWIFTLKVWPENNQIKTFLFLILEKHFCTMKNLKLYRH